MILNNPELYMNNEVVLTLYVHHDAKSTSQSCKWSSMFPTAWARSKPTIQPCNIQNITALKKVEQTIRLYPANKLTTNSNPTKPPNQAGTFH